MLIVHTKVVLYANDIYLCHLLLTMMTKKRFLHRMKYCSMIVKVSVLVVAMCKLWLWGKLKTGATHHTVYVSRKEIFQTVFSWVL